jgi:Domain of unknown function (DUF4349)
MLNVQGLQGRSARTWRTRLGVAGAVAVAAVLGGALFLAGCSSSASSSAATSGAMKEALPAGAQAAAIPSPMASAAAGSRALGLPSQGSGAVTTVQLAPGSDIIYNAQLTVRAQNVNSATSRATQIAEGTGGYVSSENNSSNPDHPSQATATITLKIPVTSYAGTLSELANSLGTQLSLQQQAQDVTEQVADVNSQVASYEAAIAQLRALLSHAGSVNDLLNVQNQINQEETQLEALEAQQRALSHETTYATVTVTILGPKAKPPVHHRKAPPSLGGGWKAGWRGLRITVDWTLAFLGAVAPFAVVAAVIAFVILRGRRWLLRRRPTARPASQDN